MATRTIKIKIKQSIETEVNPSGLRGLQQELKNATRNSVLGYASYIPRFAQSGTSAPTTTEFLNTTGASITWVRGSAGFYYAELPVGFNYYIPYSFGKWGGRIILSDTDHYCMYYIEDNFVYFETYNSSDANVDLSSIIGTSPYGNYIDLPEIKFFPA